MKKVVIGLSGGVDSAVACYLLKEQGCEVIAIYMQNWDSFVNRENYSNNKDKCDSQYEWEDAQNVALKLGVPIYKVDFIKEYWNEVFAHFIQQYKCGKTPNPDVLCNKYIKFGHLLEYAKQKFQCDFLATGHYAKVIHSTNHNQLLMAKDLNKDQTYFLCDLTQSQLKFALFPLENLDKNEVRDIAKKIGLEIWNKKDSTGICFIGERNFKNFLTNYIPPAPGDIVDIQTKQKLGEHSGVAYYTLGQNHGLSLGGLTTKYYVCKKEVESRTLYVVDENHKDKYLSSNQCVVENFNWIVKPSKLTNLHVRFRHRQKLIECEALINIDQHVIITYHGKNIAVTPGQYAVLYNGLECLGGGEIVEIANIQ